MYIRFVVGTESDHHKQLRGMFFCSYRLKTQGRLESFEEELLDDTFRWFNQHLPCPPFKENLEKKIWSSFAVSYYKDTAKEFIEKMRILAHLLNEHGEPVRVIRSSNPGKVLYEDDYQIIVKEYKVLPKRKVSV